MSDSITLNGVEYVRADLAPKRANLSEFFIFRCRDAGVHFGRKDDNNEGNFVVIRDSRRLWKWVSKSTLSELSQEGPLKISENKYGTTLPMLMLRASDICEIIPVTETAAAKILAVPNWEACK